MKESLKLSLSQKLQQRFSPLQMRFVRLLEMNGPEIEDDVRRELDDNPALEVAENTDTSLSDTDTEFNESAEDLQRADYRDEDDIPAYRLDPRNHSRDDGYFEPVAVAEETATGNAPSALPLPGLYSCRNTHS